MIKKDVTTDTSADLFDGVPLEKEEVKAVEPKETTPAAPAVDMEALMEAMELKLLKEQADQMEVTYHPSIGIPTLRAKIAAALNAPAPVAPAEKEEAPAETAMAKANRLRAESLRLIRVVVNCMNPAKQSWESEPISVSNAVVGTVKKLIPFNLEAGYHIPYIIYLALKERQCAIRTTVKDPRTGVDTPKMRLIKEFNIVVLDPLTKEELAELATQQAVNNSID